MNPASSTARGIEGKERAVAFLASHGYKLLTRNVRLPGGEIDAVCLEGGTLVFVEVKRRSTGTYGSALAAVDRRKRARLRSAAADYAQIVAPTAKIRFDVVTLDGNRIRLHRNAF
jgi:putative endonuclease